MSLQAAVKPLIEQAAHSLGPMHIVRFGNRKRVRVLMYHRFQGPEKEMQARMKIQCEHLRRYYHSVSLSEVAEAARGGNSLPANAVAITVDDGYRDFGVAFPIFQAYELKVTLYVVSGFADGSLWLWPDQLLYLLENSRRPEFSFLFPGEASVHYSLKSTSDRNAAFDAIAQGMIRMPNQDRLHALSSLPEILDLDLPAQAPEQFAALSWEQLRSMSKQGLDIGAHTDRHPIVSRLETANELQQEIRGSKAKIEAAVGVPVNHFCYPNGKFADVSVEARREVESAGYVTAVLAEQGFADSLTDLFQLRRIGIDPEYQPLYFERRLAGFRA